MKKIDDKNIKNLDLYNKINIGRGTFNKIINGDVHPQKKNVALLALGLNLNSKEYDKFLRYAGHARSNDEKDILNIVGYYVDHRASHKYSIMEIDDAIYQMANKTLVNYGE